MYHTSMSPLPIIESVAVNRRCSDLADVCNCFQGGIFEFIQGVIPNLIRSLPYEGDDYHSPGGKLDWRKPFALIPEQAPEGLRRLVSHE